jgi:hypothetical protein
MHGLPANAAQPMLRARSLFVRSARRLAEVAVGLGVGLGGRLLLLRLTRAASDAAEARRISACDTYCSLQCICAFHIQDYWFELKLFEDSC